METTAANLTHRRRRTEDLVRALALTTQFGDRLVLDGIDLAIRRGEVFVIMGPSGCGKTTLLRNLCGLLPPTLGSVSVAGHDLYAASPALLQHLRLRTGLSFQGGALLGSLSVLDNVSLPLRENTTLPAPVIREIARMKLDMVGLLHAADLLPSSLSGGMKKRAAIARAIALDPDIVYFDEPSAGLDPITAAEIDNVITKLNKPCSASPWWSSPTTCRRPIRSPPASVVLLDGKVKALGERDKVWHDPDPQLRDVHRAAAGGRVRNSRGMDVITHLEI
jgi:phospholipid/cholesterol/gamma-HCH transport system ATP-binding protein